jgi:predicted NAD-dependent protein-ADP-ribosyltransferase YbiA (DUF1768 family)
MEHKKTLFYFESKGVEWMVEYFYETETRYGQDYQHQRARIYTDGDLYHDFEKMPYTKTHNLTKTHAKEIITNARKLNKERDKRDSKIKKILDGAK